MSQRIWPVARTITGHKSNLTTEVIWINEYGAATPLLGLTIQLLGIARRISSISCPLRTFGCRWIIKVHTAEWTCVVYQDRDGAGENVVGVGVGDREVVD